jgi:hypothetical protein
MVSVGFGTSPTFSLMFGHIQGRRHVEEGGGTSLHKIENFEYSFLYTTTIFHI